MTIFKRLDFIFIGVVIVIVTMLIAGCSHARQNRLCLEAGEYNDVVILKEIYRDYEEGLIRDGIFPNTNICEQLKIIRYMREKMNNIK